MEDMRKAPTISGAVKTAVVAPLPLASTTVILSVVVAVLAVAVVSAAVTTSAYVSVLVLFILFTTIRLPLADPIKKSVLVFPLALVIKRKCGMKTSRYTCNTSLYIIY